MPHFCCVPRHRHSHQPHSKSAASVFRRAGGGSECWFGHPCLFFCRSKWVCPTVHLSGGRVCERKRSQAQRRLLDTILWQRIFAPPGRLLHLSRSSGTNQFQLMCFFITVPPTKNNDMKPAASQPHSISSVPSWPGHARSVRARAFKPSDFASGISSWC